MEEGLMMMMKLGDGILIASSVVPSIETTDFALFIVSFSPTINGKKEVEYASLLQTERHTVWLL